MGEYETEKRKEKIEEGKKRTGSLDHLLEVTIPMNYGLI